jgi:hypothetical protein
MFGVDSKADKYSSLSPYNYSFNDPVYWSDPLGDDPNAKAWDEAYQAAIADIHAEAWNSGRNAYAHLGRVGDDDLFPKMGVGSGQGSYDHQAYMGAHLEARESGGKLRTTAGGYWIDTPYRPTVFIDGKLYYNPFGSGVRTEFVGSTTRGSGDGYSSFEKALMFINEFNPIANAWDALSGYVFGTDRFNNPITKADATWEAASVIPIGKAVGYVAKGGRIILRSLPFTTPSVASAAKLLKGGSKSVKVATKAEAEELFLSLYQGGNGKGLMNTTGLSATEVKNFYGSKLGTYHWDLLDTQHGGVSHLQIHAFDGTVTRIFFGN